MAETDDDNLRLMLDETVAKFRALGPSVPVPTDLLLELVQKVAELEVRVDRLTAALEDL